MNFLHECLLRKRKKTLLFNPISGGYGSIGPMHHTFVCNFHVKRARITKIGDFVSLTIWLVPHSKLRPIYPQIKMWKYYSSKILLIGVSPKYSKARNAKKNGYCLESKDLKARASIANFHRKMPEKKFVFEFNMCF